MMQLLVNDPRIMKASPIHLAVAYRIAEDTNPKKRYAYRGNEGLAEWLGVSVRTVQRAKQNLVKWGWISQQATWAGKGKQGVNNCWLDVPVTNVTVTAVTDSDAAVSPPGDNMVSWVGVTARCHTNKLVENKLLQQVSSKEAYASAHVDISKIQEGEKDGTFRVEGEGRDRENVTSLHVPQSPIAALMEFVRRPEWGWGEDAATIAQKLVRVGNDPGDVLAEFEDAAAQGYSIDEVREIMFCCIFQRENFA